MHIYNSYIINSFPDGSLTKYQMEINFIIFGSMFGICLNHFSTVKSRNFATVNLWKYYGFLTEKIWRSFFFFFFWSSFKLGMTLPCIYYCVIWIDDHLQCSSFGDVPPFIVLIWTVNNAYFVIMFMLSV